MIPHRSALFRMRVGRDLMSFSLLLMRPPPPRSTLFPYTTLFRSVGAPTQRADLLLMSREEVEPLSRLGGPHAYRSEEHTSELQSRRDVVCRLLLEKKK